MDIDTKKPVLRAHWKVLLFKRLYLKRVRLTSFVKMNQDFGVKMGKFT